MAFSYTRKDPMQLGTRALVCGTFTGTGVTTGDIVTGLKSIFSFVALGDHGTTPVQKGAVSGGTQTLNFADATSGDWVAVGLR